MDVALRVLHVTPAFYPATFWGGPIFSTFGLCNALAHTDSIEVRVLTTDTAGPKLSERVSVKAFPMRYPAGYEVFFCRRWWAASISPSMLLRLWPMIRWADVVHLTAVYSPPTIPTLLICRFLGKPVVWSPRGALQRWEGVTKPLLKRFWDGICNSLLGRERCVLHVTSDQEARDSTARISDAVTTIIPNGVDLPGNLPARSWLPDGQLRLLYLGRLHPIKGIENLLQALIQLPDETVSLTICGSGDEAYLSHLRQLVDRLGLSRRVSFGGHVNGSEKMKAFMQADVCVVPSFSENFGMVVAEALAHGVAVIVSKGAPWEEVQQIGCGLWVENSAEELAAAIQYISKADLPEMGKRGRAWMEEKFSWERIASRMAGTYRQLGGMAQ